MRTFASAFAFIAAPLLAYNANWRAPATSAPPAPIQMARPAQPRAADLIVARPAAPARAPMENRIAREGIDFTATSATCGSRGSGGACAIDAGNSAKSAQKKKKSARKR
ncbi:MAG: hypothetical protein CTY15_09880 [Methylocystis sp.]|nr:MAG: hypothetical protein CTY15_09880 [Methylocystis sp.]